MKYVIITGICFLLTGDVACKKMHRVSLTPASSTTEMNLVLKKLNNQIISTSSAQLTNNAAVLMLRFSTKVDRSTVSSAVIWSSTTRAADVPLNISYTNNDSVLIIQPSVQLSYLTQYSITVSNIVKSVNGMFLSAPFSFVLRTGIDSSDKFTVISDNALLDSVQKRTFRYFWDYGHPVSGLARDKTNTANLDDCAVGGTGFGLLCIPIAVSRNFISRKDGLIRMQKIVSFLKTKAQTYHGAFSHRINGSTGNTILWQPRDDGGDIVETSFLMMGLLTVRQYFNGTDINESTLRDDINELYNNVDWAWFNKDGQNALYWLWSPVYNWDNSFKVQGWNETLITYVLAASSTSHTISKEVYDNGFANNGSIKNGQSFYGINLPLGNSLGGPMFLSQYSFLAIKPIGLIDSYANYESQTKNHTLINRAYCIENSKNYFGYSNSCWGLTASSTNIGYTACSPTNDIGVIAPTAALASFAFTPNESMEALRFFYYKMGDYLWKDYGFVDAFNLNTNPVWIAPQELVYNQLPIIVAIENYRTGLIWDLFKSCPEIKNGMKKLGFIAPYL